MHEKRHLKKILSPESLILIFPDQPDNQPDTITFKVPSLLILNKSSSAWKIDFQPPRDTAKTSFTKQTIPVPFLNSP